MALSITAPKEENVFRIIKPCIISVFCYGKLICPYGIRTLQHCLYRMDSNKFMISDVFVIKARYSIS